MDLNEKKLFIYKNINNISNHNDIINYIKLNNIKYTNNDNGFFVNISYLEGDKIEYLYNTIRYYIKNTNDDQLFLDKRDEIIKSQPTITNNVVKNIPMSLFSEEEQSIIKQSKKFKI